MQKYIHIFFLFLLILSTNVVLGKSVPKTKNFSSSHKKHLLKVKVDNVRIKRSLDDETIPFWPNRGKKEINNDQDDSIYKYDLEQNNQKLFSANEKLLKETPFWANRGRRDGSSLETIDLKIPDHHLKHCEHCSEITQSSMDYNNIMDRSNRDRWTSEEIEGMDEPFLNNMWKIQENEPFWGNRGRRTDNEPFWGTRGRRVSNEPLWNSHGMREEQEPFWGNRGKRQETEPFWGNRGRRDEAPFWGNRGKRKVYDWINKNKKEKLKESIINTMPDVETDTENLSRLNIEPKLFWNNRGRDRSLKLLYNNPLKSTIRLPKYGRSVKISEPGTVLDNRMYVEEPNYILVERSSRSSAEDDPYYVSRGKKYYYKNPMKTLRDRRGALEEIVKSVRNDPYNIARGKKDTFDVKNVNSSIVHDEYIKVKDLICSAMDFFMIKYKGNHVKRDINDNDRDRRTILKKLAAQLQMDPYFVSRGKKNEILITDDRLQEFISNVADKCNQIV